MSRKENYTLILLAGGKSSRMGENKAKLLYKGMTFTRNLLTKAEILGIENVLISGFEEDGFTTVWDIYPQRGPLGGIHACMKQTKTPFCVVLPVDVPQIPVEVLEDLIHFHETKVENKKLPVLLKHGERRENLIGIYPLEVMEFIEERIKEHSASVHGMLDDWGNVCFETSVQTWQVENINKKEDYENLILCSCKEK